MPLSSKVAQIDLINTVTRRLWVTLASHRPQWKFHMFPQVSKFSILNFSNNHDLKSIKTVKYSRCIKRGVGKQKRRKNQVFIGRNKGQVLVKTPITQRGWIWNYTRGRIERKMVVRIQLIYTKKADLVMIIRNDKITRIWIVRNCMSGQYATYGLWNLVLMIQ